MNLFVGAAFYFSILFKPKTHTQFSRQSTTAAATAGEEETLLQQKVRERRMHETYWTYTCLVSGLNPQHSLLLPFLSSFYLGRSGTLVQPSFSSSWKVPPVYETKLASEKKKRNIKEREKEGREERHRRNTHTSVRTMSATRLNTEQYRPYFHRNTHQVFSTPNRSRGE